MATKKSMLTKKLNNRNNRKWRFKMEMCLIKEEILKTVIEELFAEPTTDQLKNDKKPRV